ncbi:asparagine synthase (glutamine-hydrolyzing) [Rhizobium rhizogenes]|uniref:asparagine synthase (glutamine-hydrolyzing) n=1 Tax=Rhizobium rhizogenes TaxID=359 RepID=UPI0012951CA8|nr:asparagine synthase (glutamine-hydrolyzing) [Rhizobium rhizogenes]MQB34209.1 asparagine synthase (glutamine-hydrolyzing) [Rhizobium rhizogenes]
MCGIVGYIDLARRNRGGAHVLARMAEKLVHRGPDAVGYFTAEQVGFGFRRLSILDLSGGQQPMSSPDGQVVMICNGEIFNYRELRLDLEARGYCFRSQCDVEVIIYLYQEYGIKCLDHLNGQFAFALYDSARRRVLIARDPVGIIPLYYILHDNLLYFGSEIKSILANSDIIPNVNIFGLDQILSMPGLVSPSTMFSEIQSLPGGHYIVVEGESLTIRQYWDLIYPIDEYAEYVHSEDFYIEGLRELLVASVRRRLHADVPVGFYLSGGLDSSLIAGIGRAFVERGTTHSFGVTFDEKRMDESKYQREVAGALDFRHHEVFFDSMQIVDRLREVIFHCECPIKETYNTCSIALAEAAKSAGVKVVLSGEGADELFAGYIGYRFDAIGRSRAASFTDHDVVAQQIAQQAWGDPSFFYEENASQLLDIKKTLYSSRVCEALKEHAYFDTNVVDKTKVLGRHIIHKRSYLDFKLRLSDHLLSDHGDRMAMARSVECRYPFLDRDVIEFSQKIPPNLKLNNLNEKYILKKIAEGIIPEVVISRQKFGFHAQGSPFILRQNAEWVNDLLSYSRIKRQGYFNPDFVESLKKHYLEPDFRLNQPFETDFLTFILTFGVFLDVFDLPDLA